MGQTVPTLVCVIAWCERLWLHFDLNYPRNLQRSFNIADVFFSLSLFIVKYNVSRVDLSTHSYHCQAAGINGGRKERAEHLD